MSHSLFEKVIKTIQISIMFECRIDIVNVNHKTHSFWPSVPLNLSYEIGPNRDSVLRNQEVLPEVRNRPLLPREFSANQLPKIIQKYLLNYLLKYHSEYFSNYLLKYFLKYLLKHFLKHHWNTFRINS